MFMFSKRKYSIICLALALALFAAGCKKKVPPPAPPPPPPPVVVAPTPPLDQHLVLGGVALDEADPERLRAVAVAIVGVDHHVARPGGVQVAGHLAPDAAEAADDVVVGERVDHPLHAPGAQQVAEVPGDEELGDGGQRVEERTDAEDGDG